MTIKELLSEIADASDKGAPGLAIYQPSITGASRGRNGLTTITLKIRVSDFTPADVLRGMKAWLAIGTIDALKDLQEN